MWGRLPFRKNYFLPRSYRRSAFFPFRFAQARNRSRSGSTAAEMALLAPMFFLLMIGIVELSLILATQQLLDNATFNASRLAKTGYVANGETQLQTVTQILDNELSSFGSLIDASQITLTTVAYNDFANIGTGGTSGMGTEEQIVVYTVTYPWKLFTPMMGGIIGTWDAASNAWVVNLTSRIVARNEPYG
jgi:Flp pilus assembly protein TadG